MKVFLTVLISTLIGVAQAQEVYRCNTPQGLVVTDRPCDGAAPRQPLEPPTRAPVTRANRSSEIERLTQENYRMLGSKFPEEERWKRARAIAITTVDAAIEVDEYARVHGKEMEDARRKVDEDAKINAAKSCDQAKSYLAYFEKVSREGFPKGEIRTQSEINSVPDSLAKAKAAVAYRCK